MNIAFLDKNSSSVLNNGHFLMKNIGIIRCSDPRFTNGTIDFIKERYFANYAEIVVPGGIAPFIHDNDYRKHLDSLSMLKKEFNLEEVIIISHENCKKYMHLFPSFSPKELEIRIKNDLLNIKKNGIIDFEKKQIKVYYSYRGEDNKQIHDELKD